MGTYVYFDFNIVHDGTQSGWCYRLKQVLNFLSTCSFERVSELLRSRPFCRVACLACVQHSAC